MGDFDTGLRAPLSALPSSPGPEPRNRRVEVYFSPTSGLNLRGVLTRGFTRQLEIPFR